MGAAEALTDQLAVPAFSVLDDAGSAAFAAGVKAIGAASVDRRRTSRDVTVVV